MGRYLAMDRTQSIRTTTQDLQAALAFDGASSYVDTPVIASSTHFNLALWYKRGRTHTLMETIVCNDRSGTGFSLSHDGKAKQLYFTVASNARHTYAMNFPAYPVGEWHHVAITAKNHDVRGYLDGNLAFTQTAVSLPSSSTPISLMHRPDDGRFAKGILSSVVIENGTFWSHKRIKEIMYGNYPPKAYAYRLDEGTGTILYDQSEAKAHAIAYNTTYTRDVPTRLRAPVGGNLVPNGSFSHTPPAELTTPVRDSNRWIDNAGGNAQQNIFDWNFVVHSGTGMARFDHSNPFNGQPTLKLTTLTVGSHVSSGLARNTSPDEVQTYGIPVQPNTSYTARVAIKTQVLGGAADRGAYMALEEFSGAGVPSGGAAETPYITQPTDFTVYTQVFTTKSDTRYIVPQLYNRGKDGDGSLRMNAWFGDIQLVPTAAPPPYGKRFPVLETSSSKERGVGICNPFSSLSSAETIRSRCGVIKDAGLTWVRTDFRASIINPARDQFVWDGHDTLVQEVLGSGLKLLPILNYATTWGNGGYTDLTYPWLDPNDFARYCAAVVARYAPLGVKHYEIWNEPNISIFWKPSPNPVAYAALLQAAYTAIKAVDPSVTVIMGGLSGDQNPDAVGPNYHGPFVFLNNIYTRVGSPWDALGYHAYSTFASNNWQEKNTVGLREIMRARGDHNKTIWITEYGRPTNGIYGQEFLSEATQARYYSSFIRDVRKYDWLGPVFLYNYRDIASLQPDREGHFGLLRADNTYKPSFYAVRNAIKGIYL